jgi:hypothetical protein
MTPKERLHERIESLSNREAERLLNDLLAMEQSRYPQPSYDEVKRLLEDIADLHDPEIPPLPDEAWSRASIYD